MPLEHGWPGSEVLQIGLEVFRRLARVRSPVLHDLHF